MEEMRKIRFLAANFSALQGLKAVPVSLLLILVVLWANAQHGRASNLTFPILAAALSAALFWLILRYYQKQYGKVERTPQDRRLEYGLNFLGGVLALTAFFMDTHFDLPFSLVGLVFALAFLTEYFRMNRLGKGHYRLPGSLASCLIVLIASLLPLFGFPNWWQTLGLRIQLFGVLLVVGIDLLLSGLWTHGYLIRQLHRVQGGR